jgi:hypothetical protein
MDKLLTFALALAVGLGTTAVLANSGRGARQSPAASMDGDGAFRDGLYVGRLAAESGRPLQPAIGRWSSEQDRTAFAMGYRRGYGEVLASAVGGTGRKSE